MVNNLERAVRDVSKENMQLGCQPTLSSMMCEIEHRLGSMNEHVLSIHTKLYGRITAAKPVGSGPMPQSQLDQPRTPRDVLNKVLDVISDISGALEAISTELGSVKE